MSRAGVVTGRGWSTSMRSPDRSPFLATDPRRRTEAVSFCADLRGSARSFERTRALALPRYCLRSSARAQPRASAATHALARRVATRFTSSALQRPYGDVTCIAGRRRG